ncbi:methyltransferase RsmF C-terminal domain-like protein [Desertivirga brevis]|uniref:methyltransferase RsmF C-terminal domain-like protein n=1 Tax=Desertivirga brevis TaxID=2810310 RepID=UPI001A97B74B|nr:RsmB/NOP family class I SAM-dependent RNA methyltransferase [Pedobacter sp. SYSU D00873]
MSNILPSSLIRSLNEKFGLDQELFFRVHEEGEFITSVRLNPFKPSNAFEEADRIGWTEYGRYLEERPSFIADPLFHAGGYYVQEASSMFVEHILRHSTDLKEDLKVLDLCAAPGGKSTLISSVINSDSLLVSNEIIKTRVPVLADNMTKWGVINSVVTNNDPRDFQRLGGYFDVIVVDAPCSGSGMWRKDPQTINEWSENNVQLCSQRQQRILADIYPALKEGGLLIYSTCSYSEEENEEITDWLSDTFNVTTVKIPVKPEWQIQESLSVKHKNHGYRFYPHLVKGEGFFVSCFIKNDSSSMIKSTKSRTANIPKNELPVIERWITGELPLQPIPVKEGYSIINPVHAADITLLQSNLYLKKSGVFAGKIVGKDLIPDHELALSLILNKNIQKAELNYEEAISYLRKDDLKLENIGQGWTLMTFKGFGLGWAKILSNRINNYLPKELRILKEI